MRILVTGGLGFIGSAVVRILIKETEHEVINLDKISYASTYGSVAEISEDSRYTFMRCDLADARAVSEVIDTVRPDSVIHMAAESHVDRAIHGPKDFIFTNIVGTFNLLEIIRKHWVSENKTDVLFHHISTDEVYGSLGKTGYFFENTPYDPRSPYSAAKASSDHLVNAYFHTYGLPITISNCSNNYGPYQFPEKLIPLMILSAMESKPLPVYGDGLNVRDWLYVEDHCSAIYAIIRGGRTGQTYNVGGESERTNIHVVNKICDTLEELSPAAGGKYIDLITYVTDRPGHDRRYAINCDKIKEELGWTPSVSFEDGLKKTVQWYLEQRRWISNIRSGEYKKWIEKNYSER